MFTRSSSSRSLGDAGDVTGSGGGGLLQGLRKTTLLAKMGRYGSAASLSLSPTSTAPLSSSPWLEKQEVLDARTRYFLVLMKRFQEQDGSLRQLEAALGDMLLQIQVMKSSLFFNHVRWYIYLLTNHFCMDGCVESVCGHGSDSGGVHPDIQVRVVCPYVVSVGIRLAQSLADVFILTGRYDAASYKLGVDYLAVMKVIGREGADMMEQSIRFTVLDPILARLERHNKLRGSIQAWEKIYGDVVELQLSLEQQQLKASRLEKDERRRRTDQRRLVELQDQLTELQDTVTPRIGKCANSVATNHLSGI